MTIRSMTAFATADLATEKVTLRCQIKTLNSRYLEVFTKLPRSLQFLETEISAVIKKRLERGKVEVLFAIETHGNTEAFPRLNEAAVDHYLKLYEALHNKLQDTPFLDANRSKGLTITELLRFDGVLDSPSSLGSFDEAAKAYRVPLFQLLEQTIDTIDREREREGRSLCEALQSLANELEADRQKLHSIADVLLKNIYANYLRRLETLIGKMAEANLPTSSDLNMDRLHLEIGILTDKCDIDEELTRLRTHVTEFMKTVSGQGAVGRKLDFLCQEMHREVNTMSNKLVQSEGSIYILKMKQAIERIRQQVQNIE